MCDMEGIERQRQSLTKFRGYKIQARNIRRNLMLKLKNPRKNQKSSISLHSPKQPKQPKQTMQSFQTESRLSSTNIRNINNTNTLQFHTNPHPPTYPHNENNQYYHSHSQNHYHFSQPNQQQQQQQRLFTSPDQGSLYGAIGQGKEGVGGVVENFDRRMDEYLSVVFKKVENDTDKFIRQLSSNKQNENPLNELTPAPKTPFNPINTTFIKRLKINTLKLRLKKQRTNCQTVLDRKIDTTHSYSINEAQSILEKLRKTQEFVNMSKTKMGTAAGEKSRDRLEKTISRGMNSGNSGSGNGQGKLGSRKFGGFG